jgi:hypothetical protein
VEDERKLARGLLGLHRLAVADGHGGRHVTFLEGVHQRKRCLANQVVLAEVLIEALDLELVLVHDVELERLVPDGGDAAVLMCLGLEGAGSRGAAQALCQREDHVAAHERG